jgi:hypothetical protein
VVQLEHGAIWLALKLFASSEPIAEYPPWSDTYGSHFPTGMWKPSTASSCQMLNGCSIS